MSLHVYNTLSRTKEPFTPVHPGRVGMYVCGPTVYGHSHIGHAKSYVSFDLMVRYLRHQGLTVRYVQNITDVGHLTDDADAGEDKIARQARLEKTDPMQVVEEYTRSYFEDMDALNVLRPDISPRASGHIPEQIELTQKLIADGFAYERNGSVYFDVRRFEQYGKLSGRRIEDLLDAVRVDAIVEKQHPGDFALWKRAEPEHLMQWNSPWGKGYPGWHLECSVMSTKYLGQPFDIHGGGLENMFPHHECEIAQSEACCGTQFARYWLHNNMVTVDGQKMGKSLGNAIGLKAAMIGDHPLLSKAYSGAVIRYYIMKSHYRSVTDFSDQQLQAAEAGLNRLQTALCELRKRTKEANADSESVQAIATKKRAAFLEAMNDDFNTPVAISHLFDLTRSVNSALSKGALGGSAAAAVLALYEELAGDILGILSEDTQADSAGGADLADGLMRLVLELRASARERKDWGTADAVRDGLAACGVVVEDRPDGPVWKCTKEQA